MQSGKENQERPKRRRAIRNSGHFPPRKYSIFGFIFTNNLLNLIFFFYFIPFIQNSNQAQHETIPDFGIVWKTEKKEANGTIA